MGKQHSAWTWAGLPVLVRCEHLATEAETLAITPEAEASSRVLAVHAEQVGKSKARY
jgi:hypothetical protein